MDQKQPPENVAVAEPSVGARPVPAGNVTATSKLRIAGLKNMVLGSGNVKARGTTRI